LFRAAAFDIANIIYFFSKQAALMRRPTVLSLPLQLVFPDIGIKYSLLEFLKDACYENNTTLQKNLNGNFFLKEVERDSLWWVLISCHQLVQKHRLLYSIRPEPML